MNTSYKRNRGFTMIEIIVVLVVLAFVVAMLTRGTKGGKEAATKQATSVHARGSLITTIYAKAYASITAAERNVTFRNDSNNKNITDFVAGKGISLRIPGTQRNFSVFYDAPSLNNAPDHSGVLRINDGDSEVASMEIEPID